LIAITTACDRILWSCNQTRQFPRSHRFVPGERIEQNLDGLRQTLIAAKSAHDAGLQEEDHVPEAVDFAPLNDLEWLEAVRRRSGNPANP
jgi:hypothetical protein